MTQHPNPTIEDIIAQMPAGLPATEGRNLVRRAYQYAAEAHEGQPRKSGEPYIVHPLYVAYLLAEMRFEPAVIAAGLLHDVLEDCLDKGVSREQVVDLFGSEVLILVEGVTKLERVEKQAGGDSERDRDLHELESLRKLLIAMVEDDIRIIFIKLADRLHNMRTLQHLPPDRQTRMARETLEIFAPLANRLGIWVWKAEFEDIAFRYLNRTVYDQLSDLMSSRRDERHDRVAVHIKILEKALAEEDVPVSIAGRPKHFYSIYRKMQRKHVPFAQIYDVEGMRVLVDADIPLNLPPGVSEEEASMEERRAAEQERNRKESALCYRVLGVVHRLWKPVPGEFDDYIANPKPNGYQSLHTAVIGEDGQSLEIQIRTERMHYIAEYGVATHWRYKESHVSFSDKMMDQMARMRQSVQELTEDEGNARDFIDSIRFDVFQDRVYVFTPQGKVIDLPVGATPIDFAYYVHTEVGHQCRGARVNGIWTPLDYELQTGDQVKIIVNRGGGPSRHWLDEDLGFVKTNRARQKIRRWFRQKSREENAAQGRLMVDKLLRRLNLPYTMEEIGAIFHKRFQNIDDLFTAIAVGDVNSEEFVNRLEDYARHQREEEIESLEETGPPPPLSFEGLATDITVQGAGGLLTHVAQCCKPLPGEDIVGYVTRGRGVTIHRQDCPNILRIQTDDEERERLIAVDWGAAKQHTFPVQVRVNVYDRTGLLHDIFGVMKRYGINMDAVSTGKRNQDNILPLYLTLEVPDFATLSRVLQRVEQITNVISTRRIA